MKKINKILILLIFILTINTIINIFNFQNVKAQDINLTNKLKGKLLLAVEDRGRIFYVNPDDAKKYEITFANALNLFQRLSLGITNIDLEKIPFITDNWTSSTGNRLRGKLLLQVEDRGRIWYVDVTGHRHEVTWNNLMNLFTTLSLGITNQNLYKIENGETKIIYTNSTYKFTLEFPQTWNEYLVMDKIKEWGMTNIHGIYFGLPLQNSMFTISVYPKNLWPEIQNREGPKPSYLGENNQYIFGYSRAQDYLLTDRAKEILMILNTFSTSSIQ